MMEKMQAKTRASKEKEIIRFGEWFLNTLSERCLEQCGKNLSAVQFQVFKKFLSQRIKREIQFYHLCLNTASALTDAGTRLAEADIDEIIEESIDLDIRFRRDIALLPIRVDFDYEQIAPFRRERAKYQVFLFARLLRKDGADYHALVREAFSRNEFLDLHDDILEIYAEEAFVINLSIKSIIDIDVESTAYRMHCSMLDIGFKMNRKLIDTIFGH